MQTKTNLPKGTEAILVVDDIEDMAKLASTILIRLGYEVTMTSDSSVAMEILMSKGDQLELMMTDLEMPGIDGFGLAAYARTHLPHLKLLATSGYSEKLADAKISGTFDDIVAKPYRRADLALRLRMLLEANTS